MMAKATTTTTLTTFRTKYEQHKIELGIIFSRDLTQKEEEKKEEETFDVCVNTEKEIGNGKKKKALLFSRYQFQATRNEPIIFTFGQSQRKKKSLKCCLSFLGGFMRNSYSKQQWELFRFECMEWKACEYLRTSYIEQHDMIQRICR